MIFLLAQDFQDAVAAIPREHPNYRTLGLFEEAIRREIHPTSSAEADYERHGFIARQPPRPSNWSDSWLTGGGENAIKMIAF